MRWIYPILFFFVQSTPCLAPPLEVVSSVMDGAGGRGSGSTYKLISAVGQPGGIQVSSAPGKAFYAGFLNTFSVQEGLDTDADGLADEIDRDNDNDGLVDEAEISGSAFAGPAVTDPNDADTDNDGLGDGGESVAGSDPTDASMVPRITQVIYEKAEQRVYIEWQAHGGKGYSVRAIDSLVTGHPGTVVGSVSAVGGAGPWALTYTNYYHTGQGLVTGRHYRIEVDPGGGPM